VDIEQKPNPSDMLLQLTFADDLQQFLDLELESSYDFEEGKYRTIPTHLSIVYMQLYIQQIIFQHWNFLC
jgi:hypothetical protein